MGQPTSKKKKSKRGGVTKSIRKRVLVERPIEHVVDDLKPENASKFEDMPADLDLPGLGQHYCVHCSRYFVDEETLEKHKKTKNHKKRCKVVKEKPYGHEEAMLAAGMGTIDNGPRLRKSNDPQQEKSVESQ
eukprot:Rmarinus@m.19938